MLWAWCGEVLSDGVRLRLDDVLLSPEISEGVPIVMEPATLHVAEISL